MKKAVLALGSNLGDRAAHIQDAIDAISRLPGSKILNCSEIYETEPVGYLDQPSFLNAAVYIETQLSPHALLGACLGIEAAMGRQRTFQNAPRTLDVDVLVYEQATINEKELILPHPRMQERGFVLAPLRDLFPDGLIIDVDTSKAMKTVSYSGIKRYV